MSASFTAWSFQDKWDNDFKAATNRYLPPGTDWRLLKAQCYQESRLSPLAVSPVGAFGLCQFMPATAAEVGPKIGVGPDAFWLPEVSILGAGYYMGQQYKAWKVARPPLDRAKLSTAGYNAGLGNILKAQRLCDNARLYDEIVPPCLPKVTGKHSKETVGYVDFIFNRWYPMMLVQ